MKLSSLIPVGQRGAVASRANPFTSLQEEIDRLFESFGAGFDRDFRSPSAKGALLPRMDVAETGTTIELTVELPGLEEKDVEINVADNVLSIRGEKKSETERKDKNYSLVERSYGSFARSIELPPGVKAEAIQATIDKGVLTVRIAKPQPSVTQKVPVKAAA